MEAVEDPILEPAIGWLADTILANLAAGGKLNSWIRQAGLGNDVEELRSEVEAVEMVVSAVQGRSAGNKALARSLTAVKELLYDADDVVDELDGYRLQQELQPPETLLQTDGPGTQQTVENSRENADDVQSSSNGRLRSKEWIHFEITEFEQNGGPSRARCKHCKKEVMCTTKMGTSVLRNHLNSKGCTKKRGSSDPSSSMNDATTIPTSPNRKKLRTGQEPTHITAANRDGWNKDAFSERIQATASQLQGRREAITKLLKILGSDSDGTSSNHCPITVSDPRRRTSSVLQGKVYGRAIEKRSIKKLIVEHKSTPGVTILPIVGIGGAGKTTLAQLVYNDPALESQFDHKIWIWVSKNFDEMRLTREMLDYVSQETHDGLCSFPKLQEILKGHIKSKRVLLILDDVWEVMDDGRWNKLLAPFNSDSATGNMIILTTRKPSVAKKRGTSTTRPINFDGLKSDNFWLFFKACVFGDDNYKEQASLSDLGHEIAKKLKGNPLAAQTAGALLSDQLTVDHWSYVLKTEGWKSLQHTGGIMSSLKLSYDELPYPMQQCYSYCSIFPYKYKFLAEELVRLWISQGFVKCDCRSISLEEMGRYYLIDLVNLGLFEEVKKESSSLDDKTQTSYAMCGLMHDFARLVSRTECATLDGLQCNEILPNVHHLSIVTSSVYGRDDQTGNIPRSEKFESFLQTIVAPVRKLRTLVLIGKYDSFFFKAFQVVFETAHNLRLLQMSATSTDFNSFLSMVNHARLYYIKLEGDHTEQKALPHVFSELFRLPVLDLTFFMSLHTIHLEDCGESRILSSLEMLRFLKRLKLRNMRSVTKVSVPSLEELVLYEMPDLQRCSCTSMGDMKSSLRVLEIQSCPVLEVFDMFQKGHNYKIEHKSWLPNLRKLIMCNCPHLQVQTPLPPSAIFSELSIKEVSTIMPMEGSSMETFIINRNAILCDVMTLDGKVLAFYNLKNIKSLEIFWCNLISISFKGLSQLISLKSLKIANCMKLFSSDDVPEQTHEDMMTANDVALPALESLDIRGCGITGKWLSLMLRHSPTLEELVLIGCLQLKQLNIGKVQSNLISDSKASSSGYADDTRPSSDVDGLVHFPLNLRNIKINDCPHLMFDGSRKGFAGFTSIEELEGDQEKGRCLLPQSLEQLVWLDYSRVTLCPCFVGNFTCLKRLHVTSDDLEYLKLDSCTALEDLEIRDCDLLVTLEGMQSLGTLRSLELSENSGLKTLHLNSCTALERLEIRYCSSLVSLEGLRSLVNLKHLKIFKSPALDSLAALESYEPTEGISSHSNELFFPALDSLKIDDLSPLNKSFCKGLTCLRSLTLTWLDATRLTDEQETALLLLRSLQKLCFDYCEHLVHLPTGLRGLPFLKTLKIIRCEGISGLPKEGLPPSLEELVISGCSKELSEGSKLLATSQLEVEIDGLYLYVY